MKSQFLKILFNSGKHSLKDWFKQWRLKDWFNNFNTKVKKRKLKTKS